jgi:formylglycine-generating enzyme required for sulfatase activity
MADVFISYAREDRHRAERLAHALEAAGCSVWWDREILPGHDFTTVIAAELAAARAVIVIWSAASIASRWVRDEAAEGLERNALVPVLFDGIEPPMGFRSIHAADLAGWEAGDEAGFEQVKEAIAGLPAGAGPPEPVPPPRSAKTRRRLPWRRFGFAGLALAAVAAAVAFLPSLVAFKDDSDRPPIPANGAGAAVESFRDCAACPEMVPLRPGRFRMGASWFDRQSQSDERPRVTVEVAQPFAIGRHEVTFAQWDACAEGGGCNGRKPDDAGWGRGQHPVIDVSWVDAQAYVAWLREKTGKPYRLPTEAEWEYACRAGTETSYPFGDAIGPFLANHDRQVGTTREVGAYPPNPWGLHDMNGNVWEWVEDVWNEGHAGRPADAGARREGPDPQDHVIRGGSWDDRPRRVRCASRDGKDGAHREDEIGFRVALAR